MLCKNPNGKEVGVWQLVVEADDGLVKHKSQEL